ncbi:MAG: MFS transporter [Pseudomonadota bacterium]
MRILLSFTALMLSVALLQLSSGAIAPLDALSGLQEGFTTTEVGALGSAHFGGFFLGCWWAPRLMGRVGHSRAFAAFAALGAIGALAHPLLISPPAWAAMRVMTGLCIAGCYTIIEAWLQAKLTNTTRGRVLGAYRFVDLGASMVAQLMIGFLTPASYVSYNLLAILCCASLLPLMLTKASPPVIPTAPRLRPLTALRLSPLGAAGVIVAGITTPAFRMVGPVYGQEVGLAANQIGLFLAAAVLGGALAQLPTGWLADRYDRRHVLIAASALACGVCAWLGTASAQSEALIFAGSFAFGLTTFPVFSISAAHASDFAEPDEMVELSAALMFLYGAGAIVSPLLASRLIEAYGPPALFLMITAAHIGLIAFGLARMRSRKTAKERTAYRYTPRTSFTLGRLLRRDKR